MLVSLETLKTALSITGTSEDTVLQGILDRTEAIAIRTIGRSIEADDYEEIMDGHGEHILMLPNFPLISVTSIEYLVNGSWTLMDPSAYSPSKRTGEIRFPVIIVPRGFGNIRVKYRAGYEMVPRDIQDAVIKIASLAYSQRNSAGIKRERVDGAEIEYTDSGASQDAESTLLSYRQIHV